MCLNCFSMLGFAPVFVVTSRKENKDWEFRNNGSIHWLWQCSPKHESMLRLDFKAQMVRKWRLNGATLCKFPNILQTLQRSAWTCTFIYCDFQFVETYFVNSLHGWITDYKFTASCIWLKPMIVVCKSMLSSCTFCDMGTWLTFVLDLLDLGLNSHLFCE